MVKHIIQTIRWQQPTNCVSMFDHFVGLALKGLRIDWRLSMILKTGKNVLQVMLFDM